MIIGLLLRYYPNFGNMLCDRYALSDLIFCLLFTLIFILMSNISKELLAFFHYVAGFLVTLLSPF